jgi:ADP-ribose pyrophosphatase YjhB (NUDIX family)
MINLQPLTYRFCPFCGQTIGTRDEENKTRQYCSRCEWTYYPRVAASVTAIVVTGGRVLLVKRRREPHRGTWMFPSGFVDFGEHPQEALARELTEETGLVLMHAELLGVFQSRDDFREPGHFVFFYRAHVKQGEIKTDPHENETIDWFELSNVPEIGWLLHKEFIAKLRSEAERSTLDSL